MSRITLEEIKDQLSQEGWSVISPTYENLKTEMIFKCNEGHEVYATWDKIRQRRECPICKQNKFKDQKNVLVPKKKGEIRVLALDQQTHTTGYSIFSNGSLLKFGIFTPPHQAETEAARDNAIKHWLISMIQNWEPDVVALEGIQFQTTSSGERVMGVTVFETLARLQGILMDTCFESKIDFLICPTNTWRAHCKVKGRARADRKRSAQLIIKQLYDVSVSDDEADSILIGKYASDTYKPKIINIEAESWET